MKNDDDIKLLFKNCYFAGLMGNPEHAFDDFDYWYASKQREVKKLHLHSVSKCEGVESGAALLAKIRRAVADYIATEGCSCCRDIKGHDKAMKRLGSLINMDKYSDGSGYDYSKYKSKQ